MLTKVTGYTRLHVPSLFNISRTFKQNNELTKKWQQTKLPQTKLWYDFGKRSFVPITHLTVGKTAFVVSNCLWPTQTDFDGNTRLPSLRGVYTCTCSQGIQTIHSNPEYTHAVVDALVSFHDEMCYILGCFIALLVLWKVYPFVCQYAWLGISAGDQYKPE